MSKCLHLCHVWYSSHSLWYIDSNDKRVYITVNFDLLFSTTSNIKVSFFLSLNHVEPYQIHKHALKSLSQQKFRRKQIKRVHFCSFSKYHRIESVCTSLNFKIHENLVGDTLYCFPSNSTYN